MYGHCRMSFSRTSAIMPSERDQFSFHATDHEGERPSDRWGAQIVLTSPDCIIALLKPLSHCFVRLANRGLK